MATGEKRGSVWGAIKVSIYEISAEEGKDAPLPSFFPPSLQTLEFRMLKTSGRGGKKKKERSGTMSRCIFFFFLFY